MSFKQFFLPPREWCEYKLNENSKYFYLFNKEVHIQSTNIFYGTSFNGTYPGSRMCERALWYIDQLGSYSPIGYICFKCSGLLKHDKEYGILLLGNQRIDAERTQGNIVHIKLNDQEIGCFEWSLASRFFYKGSGTFFNKDKTVLGNIFLPFFFVGSNFHALQGMCNNTLWGKIRINNKNCKFQIQQDIANYKNDENFPQDSLWNAKPLKTVEPIDCEILHMNVDFKIRLLLLYIFSRSIAFYTPERQRAL